WSTTWLMSGNARFTGPNGRTLALAAPLAFTRPPRALKLPEAANGPTLTPSKLGGKLMLIASKSVAEAVSWLNALVEPFCTITGKPNVVGTRLAYTGRAQTAKANASIATIPTYLVFIYYPPLIRGMTYSCLYIS